MKSTTCKRCAATRAEQKLCWKEAEDARVCEAHFCSYAEDKMADSNITKRALASSLKELMNERPFEKINVGDICEGCNMNRKSFYYHFRDKYDLVNWIFDMEFITIVNVDVNENIEELIHLLCNYFYENRTFYRKALQIEGQNCFKEHFREYMQPVIEQRMHRYFEKSDKVDFFVQFIADASVAAFERWILDKNCMTPEEFTDMLKNCVVAIAEKISRDVHQKGEITG